LKITIETIPHEKQRYNTVGDWQFNTEGDLNIRVSETPDSGMRGSWLIAIHELVEALLCKHKGITTEMVDKFDLAYDPLNETEPGDHPFCPCVDQHCVATGIERLLTPLFGLQWTGYDNEILGLTTDYELAKEKESHDSGS
jgi:hypothetical protein